MNTKELLVRLIELETRLTTAAERADEMKDSFNNSWLSSRLLEIELDINRVKQKVEELQEIYTF